MSFRHDNNKLGDRRREQAKRGKAPKPVAPAPTGPIRVRLDHRTVITLASTKALDFWKKRYPGATIINPISQ